MLFHHPVFAVLHGYVTSRQNTKSKKHKCQQMNPPAGHIRQIHLFLQTSIIFLHIQHPKYTPKVLWIMSSHSKSPRFNTNCKNSIQNDTDSPAAVILITPTRLPNAAYSSTPMGISRSTFKNISSAMDTLRFCMVKT